MHITFWCFCDINVIYYWFCGEQELSLTFLRSLNLFLTSNFEDMRSDSRIFVVLLLIP